MTCDLTDAEWDSLKELRSGPLKKRIPQSHQIKLVALGLAKPLFESIMVTAEGRRYQRPHTTKPAGRFASRFEKHPKPLQVPKPLQLVVSNEDLVSDEDFPPQPSSS